MSSIIIPSAARAQNKASTNPAVAQSTSSKTEAENSTEPPVPKQILELRKQVAEQQRQIDELRLIVEEQRKLVADQSAGAGRSSAAGPTESVAAAASNTKPLPSAAAPTGAIASQDYVNQDAPLSLRIGSASITPVGFMDFTAVFRSTNPGSGIGTNFGSIPFNNTTAGKLTEVRFSAQNSRIGFRVDANVKDANVIGYFESDFLGPVPGNVAVSSNSDSNRLRLYWADVRKGKLEFMGGQSWSMLTPNRKGLSPLPSDLFYSQNIDVNYQAGLVWSRDPQFRIIYHPNNNVAIGISLENPEQYIGGSAGGGVVTLPSALATAYAN